MEPFSIACTTCQARLRVRDESAIGQILTCPKCGSMVLVEPVASANPGSNDPEASGVFDSSAMHQPDSLVDSVAARTALEDAADRQEKPPKSSKRASPDLTETVEDLSVQAKSPVPSGEGRIASGDAGDWLGTSEGFDEPKDEIASGLSPPPRPTVDAALLPNSDWTSASTVRWRNRVFSGIAAVVGVFLALLLFVAFSGREEPPSVAIRPNPPLPVSTNTINDPPISAAEESSDNTNTDTESTTTAIDENTLDDASSDTGPEMTVNTSPDAIIKTPDSASTTERAAVVDEPAKPQPPSDEPPGLSPKPPSTDEASTTEVPSPLSETLREFGVLLDETKDATSVMPPVDAELPPEPELEVSGAEPAIRRTGPRVIELDDRLHDPIAQLQFDAVPLDNFLKFVSDYSTIPITLDADILKWVRVSPTTPVTLAARESSVGDVLTQGLEPLGLEYRIESDQLFITRRPKEESGIRTVTFKVEDLVSDDPNQLKQLADRIMNYVSPESWSSRGGIGTVTFHRDELVIEQFETVQFEILAFCERLRVARGLKTRSPYDPSMFQLATRSERVSEKLATPIKLTYIRPAPLQRIVDRLAHTSKLHILIDWRELGSVGWSPDAEVRFSVADQPLSKALNDLLEPMDLACRVVDESTLQITTPNVLDSRLEIEFYRTSKPSDGGAAIVRAARDALGPASFREFGGGGELEFDEPSNCLLASLSQTQHIELRAWLAKHPTALTDVSSTKTTTPTSAVGSRTVPTFGRASSD
ncbi:MAG: hypothetical protein H6822_00255 [Planctomycetaceae bacterium]|nr:hypothetical protein [Planctomycetales bacterium]MCB9920577.1 hypothetical protein [Planctomycetaceae bacterium]